MSTLSLNFYLLLTILWNQFRTPFKKMLARIGFVNIEYTLALLMTLLLTVIPTRQSFITDHFTFLKSFILTISNLLMTARESY